MPRKRARSLPALLVVADDHDDSREMYADFLSRAGFAVAQAGDGAAAWKLIKEQRPALVVLDLEMPRMHGLTVLRRVRGDAALRDIPVLVLTAYDTQEQDARGAGATAVCIKPCAPDSLARLVRQLLEAAPVQ